MKIIVQHKQELIQEKMAEFIEEKMEKKMAE